MDDFEGIDFCFDDFINPDGTINEEVDKRVNGEVYRINAHEKAKQEMLDYMVSEVNKEFGGCSLEDALDKWVDYKERKGIEIDRVLS